MSHVLQMTKKMFVLFLFGALVAIWGVYAILIRQK